METKVEIKELDVGTLVEAPANPNVMEQERFALLVEAVKKIGFVQPILVRPLGGGLHEVVDGHHRLRAAREVGMPKVPCVIKDGTDADTAKAVQIGMNRLRGELNLTDVGVQISELAKAGWPIDDLTLTGFTTDEIKDLLDSVAQDQDDLVQGAMASVNSTATEKHVLEVVFAEEEDMVRVRRKLKKLGEGDMAAALLDLLKEDVS